MGEIESDASDSISIETVIEAIQASPDLDDDLFFDACDFLLEDNIEARTFLALDPKYRRKWLMRKLRAQIRIFVLLNHNKIALDVFSADTMDDVKAKIEAKKGIHKKRQRLKFKGVKFEGDRALADCGIGDDSELHLTLSTV